MAILKRIGTLFSADLNAMLDAIEDPYALLKQAMLDMQDGLTKQRQTLECLTQRRASGQQQLILLEQHDAQLEQELDLCFEAQQQVLARSVVKKRLQLTKHNNAITHTLTGLDKEIAELDKRIQQQSGQYEAMQQQAELLFAQQKMQLASAGADNHFVITDEEVEIALLSAKKARSAL